MLVEVDGLFFSFLFRPPQNLELEVIACAITHKKQYRYVCTITHKKNIVFDLERHAISGIRPYAQLYRINSLAKPSRLDYAYCFSA